MTQPTFKSMRRDGAIKRGEANAVRLKDIHIEPGFNARVHDQAFWDSVEELIAFMEAGGIVPSLEVRPRTEGGVWLVDGERRTWSYRKMAERGLIDAEHWVSVEPFKGNDIDRVLRIATSNTNKPLTAQELGSVYKRLLAFKLTHQEIATRLGKKVAHVKHILDLADGNSDVQELVRAGEVAPTIAVAAIRKHGDNAGQVLTEQLEQAKAIGKTKVTAAVTKLTFDQWFADWFANGGCAAEQRGGYETMFKVVWTAARAGK